MTCAADERVEAVVDEDERDQRAQQETGSHQQNYRERELRSGQCIEPAPRGGRADKSRLGTRPCQRAHRISRHDAARREYGEDDARQQYKPGVEGEDLEIETRLMETWYVRRRDADEGPQEHPCE